MKYDDEFEWDRDMVVIERTAKSLRQDRDYFLIMGYLGGLLTGIVGILLYIGLFTH